MHKVFRSAGGLCYTQNLETGKGEEKIPVTAVVMLQKASIVYFHASKVVVKKNLARAS